MRRTGREIPKPIDPEIIKQAEESREIMTGWAGNLKRDFENEIKAEKAIVRLSVNEDILELKTPLDYVRIAYDPREDPEKPYQQCAFHSKDEFYEDRSDFSRQVSLTPEATQDFVQNLKEWLARQNSHNNNAHA